MDNFHQTNHSLDTHHKDVNKKHKGRSISRRIAAREWRCASCSRLLGLVAGGLIQIKDRDKIHITASLPVNRQCPKCKRMNFKKEESAS